MLQKQFCIPDTGQKVRQKCSLPSGKRWQGRARYGVFFVMMALVAFFGFLVMVVMMRFRSDKGNSFGSVNGRHFRQDILHKFLQTGTGDHHSLRSFRGLHLPDIQRIVMEAGDFLRYQPGNGKGRAFTKPGSEFIHRQSSSCDFGRFCRCRAAGQQQAG